MALIKTFADQAVIAIENVRLLQEFQERTRELQLSLEEVGALSEVSRAVSSSLNLHRCWMRLRGHAVNLSKSDGCGVFEFNPSRRAFDMVASHDLSNEFLAQFIGRRSILAKRPSVKPLKVDNRSKSLIWRLRTTIHSTSLRLRQDSARCSLFP